MGRYSNSKLNTIWQCPYSYDLAYNKGIRGKQNGFAECGNLTHEVLEKYLKGEIYQFEMADYFLENFQRDVPNGVKLKLPTGYTLDLTKNYKVQIKDFLEGFVGFNIDGKQVKIIDIEKKFLLVVQCISKKIILNGIIDVIGIDDDGNYYILDHKSKKEFKSEVERREYARQLYLYSIYIKYIYGKYPIKLVFNMFRSQQLEIIHFNEKEFDNAVAWVEKSVENIENEELFLPIDFKDDLNKFEKAQVENDNLKYSYRTQDEIKKEKNEYKAIHESLKDKMFFCGNLCGHSEICENWESTLSKYKEILKGGDRN